MALDALGPRGSPGAIGPQRDATVNAICTAFAHDHLTMEELEHRLELANRAATAGELEALISDLPPNLAPVPLQAPVLSAETPSAVAPTAHGREEQTLVAIMGRTERRGIWTPARKTNVVAVMGGAELDFRQAQLPAGATAVTLYCVMSEARVIVPPGMRVETDGFAVMGSFAQADPGLGPAGADTTTLRIDGFALMSEVVVETRYPGESKAEARKRRREERRRT